MDGIHIAGCGDLIGTLIVRERLSKALLLLRNFRCERSSHATRIAEMQGDEIGVHALQVIQTQRHLLNGGVACLYCLTAPIERVDKRGTQHNDDDAQVSTPPPKMRRRDDEI